MCVRAGSGPSTAIRSVTGDEVGRRARSGGHVCRRSHSLRRGDRLIHPLQSRLASSAEHRRSPCVATLGCRALGRRRRSRGAAAAPATAFLTPIARGAGTLRFDGRDRARAARGRREAGRPRARALLAASLRVEDGHPASSTATGQKAARARACRASSSSRDRCADARESPRLSRRTPRRRAMSPVIRTGRPAYNGRPIAS